MAIVAKPICKICGKVVEENILAHNGREHGDLFKRYPNPLADLAFEEEGRR